MVAILLASTGPAAVPVAVTVVATLVVVALVAVVVVLLRHAAALRRAAGDLAEATEALRAELHATVAVTDQHLQRVDDLIGSAEQISEAVGSASRLASKAMSRPVIKAMAFGSGAAEAGRRLRYGPPVPDRRRRR